ncbi:ABC transporter [Ammoniphilus oxalaticus]|uniref:ABC transporter n=1 Tax=Ammoniphilus oxalaticus TaxID=66863 RepID=A0A419SKG2_9BACL|nr:siderophore ABC transporter substrate-binding protein [Ammoniphilus oxalaticus]RKD24477.1 ABC transporter [Ammoniphilus oxalaticus]
MRRRLGMLLMLVVVAVFAAACGGASGGKEETSAEPDQETVVVKHRLGETEVVKNPQKVVVFDFGALDSLDRLGVEVAAVPQATVPAYLKKYEDSKYVNAGSLKEPDFEAISELDPDLIIISGRQQDLYEELSKIGATIFLGVDTNRYMESYTENANILAQIFDKQAEVDTALTEVEEAIKELHDQVADSDKTALIILANEGNVSAYGPASRFGIIHDVFGFTPVDSKIEVSTHGQSISFEYIAEKNPDYLFVIDRGAVVAGGTPGAKQLVENELVKKTKAYENGKIVYLDADYWYLSGGGLISVAEMVKEVGVALD